MRSRFKYKVDGVVVGVSGKCQSKVKSAKQTQDLNLKLAHRKLKGSLSRLPSHHAFD